ncbi:ImmA/IrrE family metallo-endopeptidase [Desulfoscipio gibsoniae]
MGRQYLVEDELAERIYRFLLDFAAKRDISLMYSPLRHVAKCALNGLFVHSDINLIIIDTDLPLAKKCFVLAHELGHYVLHRRYMNPIWAKAYWSKDCRSWRMKKEAEADRFAGLLLDSAKRSVQSETGRGFSESY